MPIWKFERIMVRHRFVLIHLSEDCCRVTECLWPPKGDEAEVCKCHRSGKSKLGSWKNANRYCSVFRRSEPACASTEVSCGEFVANLRRPRPDILKAVVTHLGTPLLEAPQPQRNINAIAGLRIIKFREVLFNSLGASSALGSYCSMLKDAFNNPIFLIALAAVVLLAYVIYVIAF